MDDYPRKRAVNGMVVSRKGSSGLVLRETPNSRDSNPQFCNRLGCSGRLNSTNVTQTGKNKPLRPSVRSSCGGKDTIGSSSRTSASVSNPRKSSAEPRRKISSHLESDSSETSSVQDEPEVSEISPPHGKIQRALVIDSKNAQSREISSMEVGSSSVASSTRSRRTLTQRSGLSIRSTLAGPSSPSVSTSSSMKANATSSKYGLRNLRCSSISDIVPSNCSSPDSNIGRRSELVKKRNSEGESSFSSRGKKINGSTSGQMPSSSSLSISDSRRARYTPPNKDNNNNTVTPVRPRRSTNTQTRARVPNQGSGDSSSTAIPQPSYPEISIGTSSSGSSHSRLSSADSSLGRPTYGRSGSRNENMHRTLTSGTAEGFSRSLGSRDSLRRFNIDGIAEVLLALERIESDEGLTLEHLLSLETNLFLNGLNLYDQHRDMRLDIDNMTYEELLALEDRMGNVSTALSEEALSECLKRSIYKSIPSEEVASGGSVSNDEVKCSVCQEEYADGDEVGKLQCEHGYHAECIQEWLRHKNWCPICKASASPSTSTSA